MDPTYSLQGFLRDSCIFPVGSRMLPIGHLRILQGFPSVPPDFYRCPMRFPLVPEGLGKRFPMGFIRVLRMQLTIELHARLV
eukprot:3654950-Pyramimonas_sp.AAC.1